MTKQQAHFQAFGYEPRRMKPVHFASGFFTALTGRVFKNVLLNEVAVIEAAKRLPERYLPDAVSRRLKDEALIPATMSQADVESLRIQINGVVNNDDAMYPALPPARPAGNDYTFLSRRVLTDAPRTDGFAGLLVKSVLDATDAGKSVLSEGRSLANEAPRTLERLIEPLMAQEEEADKDLSAEYEGKFGLLEPQRLQEIASAMATETAALGRLCRNARGYGHYKRVRFYIIGLLAWLMSYLVKTAAGADGPPQAMFFDFSGVRDSRTRVQSKASYARLREMVGQSYRRFVLGGRFDPDPIAGGLFNRRNKQNQIVEDDHDFSFLESHFSDLALRMGYAQPRNSRIPDKHLELQPDTMRVLMLSILPEDPHDALTFDETCRSLTDTWNVVVGGNSSDLAALRSQGYFGFDEEDLRANAAALTARLKSLNLAVEPSDGLVLCSTNVGGIV